MAVYTKISNHNISSINQKFNIEKFTSFQGIKKGIENTNYLLKTKNKKKFILTIFEKRVVNNELPFFMELMEVLNNFKINCPKPIRNKKGEIAMDIIIPSLGETVDEGKVIKWMKKVGDEIKEGDVLFIPSYWWYSFNY